MAQRQPEPLVVSGLSVTYPDRMVLSGVDLLAQPGRRIGLVGENGVGKSTLLRAVAGRLPTTARLVGTITSPDDLVLLGQEPPFSDSATVSEVLAMTLAPLRTAVTDVERLAGSFGTDRGDAAYAAALELATSHDAIEVLTGFLRDLPGVVLLASHDRVLLDEVCTDLVDLDAGDLGTDGAGGRRFGGGWSSYELARADARRRQAHLLVQGCAGRPDAGAPQA